MKSDSCRARGRGQQPRATFKAPEETRPLCAPRHADLAPAGKGEIWRPGRDARPLLGPGARRLGAPSGAGGDLPRHAAGTPPLPRPRGRARRPGLRSVRSGALRRRRRWVLTWKPPQSRPRRSRDARASAPGHSRLLLASALKSYFGRGGGVSLGVGITCSSPCGFLLKRPSRKVETNKIYLEPGKPTTVEKLVEIANEGSSPRHSF